MNNLEKFDISKQTKPYRKELFSSMTDMLSLGMKEFTGSIGNLFGSSSTTTAKHQISKDLAKREKKVQKTRR